MTSLVLLPVLKFGGVLRPPLPADADPPHGTVPSWRAEEEEGDGEDDEQEEEDLKGRLAGTREGIDRERAETHRRGGSLAPRLRDDGDDPPEEATLADKRPARS
ncbi:MAG: hypothetical protein GTO03_09670 [Planctomycetales bacterium]|nr:hypothetical protein [Planctomycetales bacterium]